MAGRETIELVFPAGGLHRQFAFQSQPPYTTADALNVRARETYEGRVRGGSRPGLVRAFAEQLGGGTPVRLLHSVREIISSSGNSYTDSFSSGSLVTDNDAWSAASWLADGAPPIASGAAYADVGDSDADNVGAVLAARSPTMEVNTAGYTITLNIKAAVAQPIGGFLSTSIFARMNDSSPDASTSGLTAKLRLSKLVTGDTSISVSLTVMSGGAQTEIYSSSTTVSSTVGSYPSTFTLTVNSSGTSANLVNATYYSAQYGVTHTLQQTLTTAAAGQRLGFGMDVTAMPAGAVTSVDSFSLSYTQSTTSTADFNRTRMVAGAGTDIYEENNAGVLVDVGNITTQLRPLVSTEYLGKLYVADRAAGLVKVYDPAAGTYSTLAATTAATVPTKCELITTYQDCIIIARQDSSGVGIGDPADAPSPHMYYISRQGDPGDWDFSETDVAASVAGVNYDLAGRLPAPVTALFAFTDDYLIFGSHRHVFVMRGHPRQGGRIDTISHTAGIVDAHAWCRGPSNEVWFLAHDGVYKMVSGEQGYAGGLGVTRISSRLPRELQHVDVINNYVLMGYDSTDRGVVICITPATGSSAGSSNNWFYDPETDAFWPMSFVDDHAPTSMYYYPSDDPDSAALLFGCRDGYVRRFSDESGSDDGEDIASRILYGPIMLGSGPNGRGSVRGLHCSLGSESGDVTWAVRSGLSAEDAYNASESRSDLTGTWSGGRNHAVHPRAGGRAAFVQLSATGRWAIDSLSLTREHRDAVLRGSS